MTTFSYTGSLQSWTAPGAGIVTVEAWGAAGGDGQDGDLIGGVLADWDGAVGGSGGLGGYVKATFEVVDGAEFDVLVGQSGADRVANGSAGLAGGGGEASSHNGGDGGGASGLLVSTTTVVIAGGGGGGGSIGYDRSPPGGYAGPYDGGDGGDGAGDGDGDDGGTAPSAGGGTQAGGAGGVSAVGVVRPGAAGTGSGNWNDFRGGGGGGGASNTVANASKGGHINTGSSAVYSGGSGGGGGAGAVQHVASYTVALPTIETDTTGDRTGNGQVIITFQPLGGFRVGSTVFGRGAGFS